MKFIKSSTLISWKIHSFTMKILLLSKDSIILILAEIKKYKHAIFYACKLSYYFMYKQ